MASPIVNRGRNLDMLNLTAVPVADTPGNRFVNVDGSLAGAGLVVAGVSRDATKAGETLAIVTMGTEYVEVGTGGVTRGAAVASDATGKAVAVGGGIRAGIALETVAAAGFAEILLK